MAAELAGVGEVEVAIDVMYYMCNLELEASRVVDVSTACELIAHRVLKIQRVMSCWTFGSERSISFDQLKMCGLEKAHSLL